MADFVCHCTSHLNILRGDEEMDDCCLGVSALFFHPGSVTILRRKKLHFTVLPSLSLILSRLLMMMLMLMIKFKHIMP